jgi:hypothetical protein
MVEISSKTKENSRKSAKIRVIRVPICLHLFCHVLNNLSLKDKKCIFFAKNVLLNKKALPLLKI